MSSKRFAVLGFLCLFLAPVVIRAHHSFSAEFDATKGLKITGAVNKVEWSNPHAYFFVTVTEICEAATGPQVEKPDWKCTKIEPSKAPSWGFEMGSPNGLMRQGWSRKSMTFGDVITVEGTRSKDGSNYGNARTVTLGDGQKLFAGSTQPQS